MDSPIRLLVAVGDADHRQSLNSALTHANQSYDVDLSDGFEAAFQALSENKYDCLLIEIPGGRQANKYVLDKLSEAADITPVIFLNAGDEQIDFKELIRFGAVDCLAVDELTPERITLAVAGAARIARAERRAEMAETMLTRETMFDSLSELPNRVLFFDRLEQVISVARREQRQVAVLTMDLNGFKAVNATLGHAIGDKLIQAVADRLTNVARTSDTVARLGGDEFGQVLVTGASIAGAIRAAEKAIQALKEPFDIDGHHLATGVSIGISIFPMHGDDGITVMRHADNAMYAAKRNVTGYSVYSPAGEEEDEGMHVRQLSLSGDLRNAFDQNQMSLNFQPKVAFESNQLVGVEALLRWNHPDHGFVSPEVFIPLAEQTGIIEQLTHWVLNAALQQHAEWAKLGMFVPVAVNLSPVTLHEKEFSNQVSDILSKWNVSAEGLVLEITESAIMSDVARATETVNQLHDMGLRISIDDFEIGRAHV